MKTNGFKEFFESTFDQHSTYWLKKKDVPKSLEDAIEPLADKNLKVLDLGCGGGRLAKAIFPRFGSVHGIDYSPELIRQASEQHPEIKFACANFQLPHAWEQLGNFDAIVSNCAIRKDYCGNLPQVAKLCYDHLNNNG